MPLFEFTHANGQTFTANFKSIFEAMQSANDPNLIKIEKIDAKTVKAQIKAANDSLHKLCLTYMMPGSFINFVHEILAGNQFDLVDINMQGESGRLNLNIGKNCYLYITWFEMPSGNYEFVAYIS